MKTVLKQWTQLGLGVALAGGTLAACGNPEQASDAPEIEISAPQPPVETAELGEAEGGEGEGGVAIEQAATDPVVFLSALAITEAHIIAARDAHELGRHEAAAEMFAHPVSEVLFDIQPVFQQLGVEDFGDLLTDTSAAIFSGETPEQISARSDGIIAALRTAAEKAPASDLSEASIAARVAADQFERAAYMYSLSLGSDAYEPYLDGYGFFKAGERAFLASGDAIAEENQRAATALIEAIAKLEEAYPTALRPEMLSADLSTVTVAASNAVLAAQN